MYDIHVMLPDNPGSLGQFGLLMGRAGVSLEGGGMFTAGGAGHAHFLVENGARAAQAAEQAAAANGDEDSSDSSSSDGSSSSDSSADSGEGSAQ